MTLKAVSITQQRSQIMCNQSSLPPVTIELAFLTVGYVNTASKVSPGTNDTQLYTKHKLYFKNKEFLAILLLITQRK